MKKLGRYQLIAEIKRGEHGATYRGWDVQAQRLVLIKTFTPRGAQQHEESCSPNFAQEAEAYSRLAHPNVVKLLDYGFDNGVCYLALEFVEGQDLRRVLESAPKPGALPLEVAVAILYEALLGLAEIHQQNIIHRDLKPENILLSHEGRLKLCDFDLALQEEQASGAGLTGSPGYVAPEVILGEQVTALSDIFSLGVVFYEMLAGARPFQAASPSGEMNAIVRLAYLPLNKILPEAPAAIEELIARLLAKSAAERSGILPWLEQRLELGTSETRTELLRRYLAAPEQYQAAGLIAREPINVATKRRATTSRWAYAASLVGVLLLSAGWFYWRAQSDVSETPRTALSQQEVQADSSSKLAPTPPKEKIEERKTPLPATKNIAKEISTKPESTNVLTPSAPRTRKILLRSNPWAYLFLNGDSLGMTPLAITLATNETPQRIALKNPQLPLVEIALKVDEQTTDTLTFSLWEQVSQLELHITPWAEVFINQEKRGLAEGEKSFVLLPGKYHLRFVHAQLGEKTETISLRAGEVRRLAVNMF